MKVLIADDSGSSRRVLTMLLEGWGYEAVPCEDGVSALELLSRPDGPRLALLDWVMPGLEGPEVCRKLRELEPPGQHALVYLLTGRTSEQDLVFGLDAGADDYLEKPIRPAVLRARLSSGARLVAMHQELEMAKQAMHELAMFDSLTGLANRRAFDELATRELARAARIGLSSGLVLLDIDHFKSVNDTHGHQVGDEVLVEVSRRLETSLRTSDHVARFGGEEIIALLPECDLRGAALVAERMRRSISAQPFETAAGPLEVTASFGVSIVPGEPGATIEDAIARADEALYRAKRGGRNRVLVEARPLRSIA